MNPFYNALNPQNPMAMLQQLKQNPMQFLASKKLNVPQEIANDPQAIADHLVTSGQVSQEAYNRARQMANQMMGGAPNNGGN